MKLDHIGIVVEDLEKALEVYQDRMGFLLEGTEEVPSQGVRVAFLPMGEGKIELLFPLGEDTPVGKFLARKGQGIHHLCFRVDDIRAEIARMQSLGLEVIDKEPRRGAHDTLVAFLHPKSTGGVLIELCQKMESGVH